VEFADGYVAECVTRGKRSEIACGDRVMADAAQGVIETVEPRSSLLYRSDAFRQKLIAANVTQLLVVTAATPSIDENLLNRCIIAAEAAGIRTAIVQNKIDLPEATTASAMLALYQSLGYAIVPMCAKRDVSPLRAALRNNVSVLVGQSGTGKSTTINSLLPDAAVRVGALSAALETGRHTTTRAELYHLDAESDIIDSPGLQEFGLHHIPSEEIASCFVEFRPWLGQCRFRDCRHLNEPDCAIEKACSEGAIAPRRIAIYRTVLGERLTADRNKYR
jgi:ribosome biogenesis GTPase